MVNEDQPKTFLSYSRANKDFAIKLAKELKSEGFYLWLDQLDIPAGARWDREVENALKECEIFMIILTPSSIDSENVLDEIGYAIDNRKRFLPVLLEKCDVPLRLRRFQYVDFTTKSFDDGVESAKELLRNLIAQTASPKMETPAAQNKKAQAKVERELEEKRKAKAKLDAELYAKGEAERRATQKAQAEVKEVKEKLAAQKVNANTNVVSAGNEINKSTNVTQRSTKFAILWIALVWAVGFSVSQLGLSIAYATDEDYLKWISITMVIGGALIGLVTGVILKREHIFSDWKNMAWMTLGGLVSMLIAYRITVFISSFGYSYSYSLIAALGGLIGGAVYGFITAILLKNEHILVTRKSIFQMLLLCAVSLALGRAISEFVLSRISYDWPVDFSYYAYYLIGGLFGGAVNAYFMFSKIHKEIGQNKAV